MDLANDKLYATKVERTFDPILQPFIRYGRRMYSYRVVADELGVLVVGQPFGPNVIRAIGLMNGKPVLATYNVHASEWSSGETELSAELSTGIQPSEILSRSLPRRHRAPAVGDRIRLSSADASLSGVCRVSKWTN